MGKKGTKKRTKWQALPLKEAGAVQAEANGDTTNAAVAVGFKKFRDFSTYNGDNSYKTAVLGPQRGYNNHHHYSARQHRTNGCENGLPPEAITDHNGGGNYVTDKDQENCPPLGGEDSGLKSTTATTMNGHGGYYNNHRYNRDYPMANGRQHFSTSSSAAAAAHYKSTRYQPTNHHQQQHHHHHPYPSRDSNSVHSSYSASHHKNSGASSTTSSTTTSSSYRNYDNNNTSSWFNHRRNANYSKYKREYSGYASNNASSGNDEYTRITTPRQDVLFKKGYLSRPKRTSAMEEGYLGTPLISQVPNISNGDPNMLLPPGDNPSPNDLDLLQQQQGAINEDNSPLYFCPGFVDHNGFFHANPTFMPNSYDQFGQPIVIMPYGPPPVPPQTVPLDGPVPFELSDNATTAEEEPQPENMQEEVATADEMTVANNEIEQQNDLGENLQENTNKDEIVVESIAAEQLELPIIEPTNEAINPLPNEAESNEVPLEGGEDSTVAAESPEVDASSVGVIEEEPVNAPLPLDPASNSFYPQSSIYPYYPMVFTPQQLPPNTSIIPLADLYYNENYAGLAAEIFGLTESNIQSDDSTADTVPPCDVEVDQLSAGIGADEASVPLMVVDGGDAVAEGEIVAEADEKTNSVDGATVDEVIPQPVTPIVDPQPNQEPSVIPIQLSTPFVQIENVAEVVANSNLKVDVAEFHPRIPINPIPEIPAIANTTVPNHKPYRTSAHYYNNHHNHHQDQYPRRRHDDRPDDYRRRRYGDNSNNGGGPHNPRSSRKTFNNSTPVVENPIPKVEEKKPERSPLQTEKQVTPSATAQKTIPKSANKTPNSKRAIQESIKHIEEQNIDLSRTSIAAVQSTTSNADSNQWLVKTKGKKKRAAAPIDIPEDDMFANEEEVEAEVVSTPIEEIVRPEVIIKAPVVEVVEEIVKNPPEISVKETKTPTNKQKKSANGKTNSPATGKSKGKNSGNKKSKTPSGKGTNAIVTKGFEVIEPDFGIITRLKTEPISLDPDLEEELEHILNMKDIEEELARPLPVVEDLNFRKSTSLPKSPRSEKDNIIDLDDLEALEGSLMDFDLSGELKERMIEIIQSEMEAPLGGTEEKTIEENKLEDVILIKEDTEDSSAVVEPPNGPEEEILEVILPEQTEVEDDKVVEPIEVEVPLVEEEKQMVLIESSKNIQVTFEMREAAQEEKYEEPEQEKTELHIDQTPISAEDQNEQTELKIITSNINVDEHCTGSSSSSSSLSSPIPTDDGRDGSNSESDDAMTPPQIHEEDQEKKMVLPSQLEGRLFPRAPTDNNDRGVAKESSIESDTTEVGEIGITASVSKWLEEKEKECSPEPIFRIPDDPQVAKMIFKAMYGVELALDDEGDFDEEEFETEDDMDSLSADESDYEPDSRDALKDLLSGRGQNGSGGGKRDNQVPIDTDSDYMSDGQNIKPADVQSGAAVNGKLPNNNNKSSTADSNKAPHRADGSRGRRAMCKVM